MIETEKLRKERRNSRVGVRKQNEGKGERRRKKSGRN